MRRTRWYFALTAWTALIWFLTTTPQPMIFSEPWYQSLLMSFSHFSFFGIEAILFRLSRFSSRDALTLTGLYGAVIEAWQLDIPGRSADPLDWLLDILGALTFLIILKKLQSRV